MAIEEYIGVLDASNFRNVNNDNDCEAEGGPEIPVQLGILLVARCGAEVTRNHMRESDYGLGGRYLSR